MIQYIKSGTWGVKSTLHCNVHLQGRMHYPSCLEIDEIKLIPQTGHEAWWARSWEVPKSLDHSDSTLYITFLWDIFKAWNDNVFPRGHYHFGAPVRVGLMSCGEYERLSMSLCQAGSKCILLCNWPFLPPSLTFLPGYPLQRITLSQRKLFEESHAAKKSESFERGLAIIP